ncbi:MAG: universal stress protein [Deltaproteobacteria bacterium]|nr:universal stress protein [Deltaproteobacteria bacterium]
MIKRILVPLDRSESCRTATRVAAALAAAADATLDGVAVFDLHAIEDSTASMGIGSSPFARSAREDMVEDERDEVLTGLRHFEEECRAAGVRSSGAVRAGDTTARLVEEIHGHDLTVMGGRTLPGEGFEHSEELIRHLLVHAARPMLVAGRAPATPLGPALLGWDGSLAAAQALQSFALLFPPALVGRVTVATLHGKAAAEGAVLAARNQAEIAVGYLRAHGFEAELRVEAGEARDRLPALARSLGVRLVILGAYSHTRLQELVFGSVTRRLVDDGEFHLFLDR